MANNHIVKILMNELQYSRNQRRILTVIMLGVLSACAPAVIKKADEPQVAPVVPAVVVTPVTPVNPVVAPTTTLAPITQYAKAYKRVSFAQLPGWAGDDLREAWPAFLNSCSALKNKEEWRFVCQIVDGIDGKNKEAVRAYFERFFSPYQVVNADASTEGTVTGYYEPLLKGSRTKTAQFQTALYRAPEDLLTIDLGSVYPELKNMRLRGRVQGNKVIPYATRAEILPFLAGKEIVWVDDAVDAFFLQIQGSGRVQLDGNQETIRLAYADQNGHPYKSIGKYLVSKGELTLDQASAQGIKEWIAKHPARRDELLNANPSVVFFKEEKLNDPSIGPKGALGVPLTAQRSIAIDATQLPLGAPVFLSTSMPLSEQPLQRLMLAQDTGGAIRGAVRADFFWGFGREAGETAGRMKQRGALFLLLPAAFEASVSASAK